MKPQPEPELALSHYYVTQRRAKCEGGYCATLRARNGGGECIAGISTAKGGGGGGALCALCALMCALCARAVGRVGGLE